MAKDGVAVTGSPMADGGPLRGDKPKEYPVDERVGQRTSEAGAGGQPRAQGWGKRSSRGWVFRLIFVGG
ncbi:hypothetical protein Slala03_78940 [Streptomyces lavendulae subsp. lavendulae]|nr:hypothetical protein Slala03_78940 [Streptomyces lavendulae subsp. lavendulae]